jgi:hypothetical protein
MGHTGGIREAKDQKLECGWCAHCIGMNMVMLIWLKPLREGD